MVAHAVDLQHSNFLERPLCDLLREFAIDSLAGFAADSLDSCIEPLVCEHIQRS